MTKRMISSALALALLALAACDNLRSDPFGPPQRAGKVEVGDAFASVADPSLPSAASVLTPPTTPTAKDEAATRPNANLTRAEESSAMPKSGQANNYSSTALDPGKAASAP